MHNALSPEIPLRGEFQRGGDQGKIVEVVSRVEGAAVQAVDAIGAFVMIGAEWNLKPIRETVPNTFKVMGLHSEPLLSTLEITYNAR